jgi:hypothetical protein
MITGTGIYFFIMSAPARKCKTKGDTGRLIYGIRVEPKNADRGQTK